MTQPFRDLVDESFDEAAFLWKAWERELTSLTRNLDEVWSWTEDRLHGALDGIRVGGDAAIDLSMNAVQSEEPDHVAIGAGILASSSDQRATDALVAAIAAAEGDRLSAIVRGLELLGAPAGLRASASALKTLGPHGHAALCRLKAFHRSTLGDEVTKALAGKAPNIEADVLRSISRGSSDQFDDVIASAMQHDDTGVRSAAVEAGVRRGIPRALDGARHLAQSLEPVAAPHLKLLALGGTPDDHEIVYGALRVPALQVPAIWALGHIGTPRAAEACLAGMRHEHLARAAGEAYCWITGANLVRDRLTKTDAAPDAPAFEDDDLDADLVPSPEAMLPVPDADATREHWRAHAAAFAPEVRHVLGRPMAADTLLTTVETGPMIRRSDIVLELRFRTRGAYDVETRAFSARQRQMMAAGRSASFARGGY